MLPREPAAEVISVRPAADRGRVRSTLSGWQQVQSIMVSGRSMLEICAHGHNAGEVANGYCEGNRGRSAGLDRRGEFR